MIDPLSLIASAITLADVGVRGVHFALELCEDYKDAELQMALAQYEHVMLQEIMERVSFHSPSRMERTKRLLETISERFPDDLHCRGRKDRWLWAIKEKRRFEKLTDRLKPIAVMLVLELGAA